MNNEVLQIFKQCKKTNLLFRAIESEKIREELKNVQKTDRLHFLLDKTKNNDFAYILTIDKDYITKKETDEIYDYLVRNENYDVLNIFYKKFVHSFGFIVALWLTFTII